MIKEKYKNISSNINKYIKYETNNFYNRSNLTFDLHEKINEILSEEMNKECFDCGMPNPKYISINNGIFLCFNCVKIHNQFPSDISSIKNNNIFSLSNKEILYVYYGGNRRLNHFVNYEYPGLQNYQPNILYQTQAMSYYRKRLTSTILKLKKPTKPNSIFAYKLIGENTNKYSKHRFIFVISDNYNNINTSSNNINTSSNNINISNNINNNYINKNINDENGNNFINEVYNKNINVSKNNEKHIGSSYIKTKSNLYHLNTNWKNRNKTRENIERNIQNTEYQNLYNNTFFEEMKNIFKYKNLMTDLRLKSNELDSGSKMSIKDDSLTHKACLTNTIYFPNNNLSNSSTNYNYIKNNFNKVNHNYYKNLYIHKFSSLKNLDMDNKDNSINKNKIMKVYTRPRMSNNSFTKNRKLKNHLDINNSSFNRKTNSIINEMSKFSFKKINLREQSPLNKKENGYIPDTEYYSKSNTNRKQLSRISDVSTLRSSRNQLNYKISNYMNKEREQRLHNKELSFNNQYRKMNLNLSECFNNNINEGKYINEYVDKKRNSRLYEDNNTFKNSFGKTYNSLITVNRTEHQNTMNQNNYINKTKSDDKKRNFIKVIKTSIGRRNNSIERLGKGDNFIKKNSINYELNTNIKNKINNFNINENINNIFLCDNHYDRNRIVKAIQDKKEQEIVENEECKKLFTDVNLNSYINTDILNRSDNQYQLNIKEYQINYKDKSEEIINGGISNNIMDNNLHFVKISPRIFKRIKFKSEKKNKNEDNYFYNKKNCTDLILVSKQNNKVNKINDEIPKEFIKELNNIIEYYKNNINNNSNNNNTKNGNDQKYIKNSRYINKKNNNNKKSLTIASFNKKKNNNTDNKIIPNNSIRNKYKQKIILNKEKKNNKNYISTKTKILNCSGSNNSNSNNDINNEEMVINDDKKYDKGIKNFKISEDNWNINLIAEINIYKETKLDL